MALLVLIGLLSCMTDQLGSLPKDAMDAFSTSRIPYFLNATQLANDSVLAVVSIDCELSLLDELLGYAMQYNQSINQSMHPRTHFEGQHRNEI